MILINAFQLEIPPAAALLVIAATNLGAVIPSSPGALGIYHFMAVIALSVWRVDTSTAVAFAIAAHASSIALHIAFGLVLAGADNSCRWRAWLRHCCTARATMSTSSTGISG
jgi:uncharacterized membrane protein YbhN (UPF0104 family)